MTVRKPTDVRRTEIADAALVVVDAVSGVEVQTENAWNAAATLGIPRLLIVNRMDRERASFSRTLESLQGRFGRGRSRRS